MRVAYNKLVRDQIPDIIAAAGSRPSTRVLDHASYQAALRAKLLEEAQEAEAAADEQLASELADVLEVLRALATAHGMRWEDIELQARRKRAERGGFDRRIFLEHVDQVLKADAGVAAFTCLETPIAAWGQVELPAHRMICYGPVRGADKRSSSPRTEAMSGGKYRSDLSTLPSSLTRGFPLLPSLLMFDLCTSRRAESRSMP